MSSGWSPRNRIDRASSREAQVKSLVFFLFEKVDVRLINHSGILHCFA
jgi:hypothetical protein